MAGSCKNLTKFSKKGLSITQVNILLAINLPTSRRRYTSIVRLTLEEEIAMIIKILAFQRNHENDQRIRLLQYLQYA